jgi:hypothetical protein
LAAIQPAVSSNLGARSVAFALAEATTPVALRLLCDSVVAHLDREFVCGDVQSIETLMADLLSHMGNDLKGAFLHAWLDHISSGIGSHVRAWTSLSVAIHVIGRLPSLSRPCKQDLIIITKNLVNGLPKALPERARLAEKVACLKKSGRTKQSRRLSSSRSEATENPRTQPCCCAVAPPRAASGRFFVEPVGHTATVD